VDAVSGFRGSFRDIYKRQLLNNAVDLDSEGLLENDCNGSF